MALISTISTMASRSANQPQPSIPANAANTTLAACVVPLADSSVATASAGGNDLPAVITVHSLRGSEGGCGPGETVTTKCANGLYGPQKPSSTLCGTGHTLALPAH